MVIALKKTFWISLLILNLLIIWVVWWHSDWMAVPPKMDAQPGWDKQGGLPDPNRPFYDAQGNKYDYQGNLIDPAQPAQSEGFYGK